MYYPLVATIGDGGAIVDLVLHQGNAHCAEGGLEFISPLVDRLERELCVVAAVRIDAGMPDDKLLSGDGGSPRSDALCGARQEQRGARPVGDAVL